MSPDSIRDEGCVHGRFQPPHRGHLEYISAAAAQCRRLTIGITRFDIRTGIACETASHRATEIANPLTYYERLVVLEEMFADAGIPSSRLRFVPFPIDRPVEDATD